MSESKTMVDQKVSELCEQLKKLSSIQERAQTAKEILEKLEDVCNDLRSTGDKQVESIEEKIDSFGEGQIEKIRGCLDGFIDSTKNVVSNVDESLVKLDRCLEKIEKTPLVEELRGVRENVSMRLDTLEGNVKQLAAVLFNATSEVGIVKDRLAEALKKEEERDAETRGGIARLDATVKRILNFFIVMGVLAVFGMLIYFLK